MEERYKFLPIIKIPNNIEPKLRRVSKRRLGRIYSNTELVIEAALTIVANLTNTYEISKDSNIKREKEGYKPLSSKILSRQVKFYKHESSKYRSLLDLLIEEDIIEQGKRAKVGYRSNEYRLTNKYFGKMIVKYILVQKETISKSKIKYEENYRRLKESPIGRNAIKTMLEIEFPKDEEVLRVVEQAVKDGYTNRKGKRLVWLGKNSLKTYPHEEFVFAEDYIKDMKDISISPRMPVMGGPSSGGRVYTSYNMCNSLLRPLIKQKKLKLLESDYSCMHPQLIQTIYGEETSAEISHLKVSKYLGLNVEEAKREHLSYFNKNTGQMKSSPLDKYYMENFKETMCKVIEDKEVNNYKITSRRLFELEVRIMSEVLLRLEKEGIYPLYVFDALHTPRKHVRRTRRVMNQVAEEFGTTTRVKK